MRGRRVLTAHGMQGWFMQLCEGMLGAGRTQGWFMQLRECKGMLGVVYCI